jgi:hypothetical protein
VRPVGIAVRVAGSARFAEVGERLDDPRRESRARTYAAVAVRLETADGYLLVDDLPYETGSVAAGEPLDGDPFPVPAKGTAAVSSAPFRPGENNAEAVAAPSAEHPSADVAAAQFAERRSDLVGDELGERGSRHNAECHVSIDHPPRCFVVKTGDIRNRLQRTNRFVLFAAWKTNTAVSGGFRRAVLGSNP